MGSHPGGGLRRGRLLRDGGWRFAYPPYGFLFCSCNCRRDVVVWRVDLTSPSSPFVLLTYVTGSLRGMLWRLVFHGKMSEALSARVDRRLGQISVKILRLAERFAAGTLRAFLPRSASVGVRVQRLTYPRPASIWPRKNIWLVVMQGHLAAGCGESLRYILVQPDVVALLKAGPQAARIMLPMCRMLGVETSLLYPGVPPRPVVEKVALPKAKRVRKKLPPIDWGRIPLPRGMLSAARRAGFKPVR